ncbi:conserved hypothetical protein [Anaeromyxobacter dehalogenans 2CP-1]|uniref:Uncharacterized protein n=1 Tax=Anaeromyxobacter dehalogenans (strain ATCC BAA-258 / DSM 21875 / 2CP-1) TaxID=455488 RepID=B8J6U0_ANAD2|nr:hypothetical protein [Anaeromyxobacter dehalogenans]ACL67062.1 conserved hypothetical protein [Anaeromyxobacter dehalogenans 2CP-1]
MRHPPLPATAWAPMVAIALASLSGCAGAGSFRCPEQGGRDWHELRTEHVVLQTDLPSWKAKELAGELERMFVVVRSGLFRNPPPAPGLLRVVALVSESDLKRFAPRGAAAYYHRPEFSGPVVVMPGTLGEAQRRVIAHEVTLHLTAQLFARQPPWFREGLASFMESMGTEGSPTLGGAPEHWSWLASAHHGRGMRAADVLTASRFDDRTGAAYAESWALVHFLVNREPERFRALQVRFARGQDPTAAWREVFPEWDPAAKDRARTLDEALDRYLNHGGKYTSRPVRLPPAPRATDRTMTAAEVHAARLALLWEARWVRNDASWIRAEAEHALTHDPGHVDALALLAASAKAGEALRLMERATAAHPEDGRAWLALAAFVPAGQEERRLAALQRAVAADGTSAAALSILSAALLAAGRSGEALPLARRAVALEPWKGYALVTLSRVLEDLGQCPEALALQRRAVDVSPEGSDAAAWNALAERRARLESACGTPPAPAPATAPGAAP